jgi:hypothetical protein
VTVTAGGIEVVVITDVEVSEMFWYCMMVVGIRVVVIVADSC